MRLDLKCTVDYLPGYLMPDEAQTIFDELMELNSLTTMAVVDSPLGPLEQEFGKLSFVDLDRAGYDHAHHGNYTSWSPTMMRLREKIEATAGRAFNVCVCIYYPNGHSGVSFHSDLVSFGDTSIVPSLSLGATRQFQFRENATGEITSLDLKAGDLVIMGPGCQENYQHSVPLDSTCSTPRINLTFRPIGHSG